MMTMRKEIRISGFGGQGVITAGIILAKAAAIEGFEVLQTQSYGSEARGGACKADVTISDGKINDLVVEAPDILACMSNIALAKYMPSLKAGGGGVLVINSDLVKTDFHGEMKKIPATTIGGAKSANIAMVAALAKLAGIGKKSLEAAVMDTLGNRNAEILGKIVETSYTA